MAFAANSFGILDGDEDDNIESLLSRVVAKAEQPPPAVPENTTNNNKKPSASSKSSSDHGKTRKFTDPEHVSRRPNKNGVERYNNGHDNDYRQNNGKVGNFRKNNGYYQENQGKVNQGNGRTDRRINERDNDYHNKQEIYVNDRPNDRNNGQNHYMRVDSAVNGANYNTRAQAPNNCNGIQRGGNSGRRATKENHPNGSEVKDGDNKKPIESQGKVGDSVIEDVWEVPRSRRRRRMFTSLSNSVEGKEQSKLKEKIDGEGVEKEVVGSEEGDAVTVKADDSKESEPKNEESEKVLSKEEAERLAESKKMTLKEYEQKLENERKKKLEDKSKEVSGSSMIEGGKVVTKRNLQEESNVQESSPENLAQSLFGKFNFVSNFRRRGGRFSNEGNTRVENNNFGPGRGNADNKINSVAPPLKKAYGPKPPPFEDANQFPALGAIAIRN